MLAPRRFVFGALVALGLLSAPRDAAAESGRLNGRIFVAGGFPAAGPNRAGANDGAGGAIAGVGLDWQFAAPFAAEIQVGGGAFRTPLPMSGLTSAPIFSLMAGGRFRMFDDDAGALTEDGGNPWGHLFIASHVGYVNYDGAQLGLDIEAGYVFSLLEPLQVGPFARTAFSFGGERSGSEMILVFGVTAEIELMGPEQAPDADGDGLSDDDELEAGTNPMMRDTDRDGIDDGTEVETGTSPTNADTDRDGLNDGTEDRNHDGHVDAGETDPRDPDTDGGGIIDGDERRNPNLDPLDPSDDDTDGDGVANFVDRCPGTPRDAHIGADGCPVAGGAPTPSDGDGDDHGAPTPTAMGDASISEIRFVDGRSRLASGTDAALGRALVLIREAGEVRFEIVVGMASSGDPRADLRLTQRRAEVILNWLVQHGIDRSRLDARGAGTTTGGAHSVVLRPLP